MVNYVIFDEKPDAILYVSLPDGKADIWIRRNIREFAAEEDSDGERITIEKWAADEAYMRETLPLYAVEADPDAAFERAAAWKQGYDEVCVLSTDERLRLLERENAELFRQLTNTQLALCELYESLIEQEE
jgi:hypothetical protein